MEKQIYRNLSKCTLKNTLNLNLMQMEKMYLNFKHKDDVFLR